MFRRIFEISEFTSPATRLLPETAPKLAKFSKSGDSLYAKPPIIPATFLVPLTTPELIKLFGEDELYEYK